MSKKYRIFISYRGIDTPSYKFAKQLYETLTGSDGYKKKFGEVFFSPNVAIGNFKKDIKKNLKNVKYFIIPYHKDFFGGFATHGGSIDMDSITCREIRFALKKKCKFVPVFLDDERFDATLLKSLFGDKYIRIYCANQTFRVENGILSQDAEWNRIIGQLSNALIKKNAKCVFIDKINNNGNNVNMKFRIDVEETKKNSYYENFYNSKRISLMNLAATSFLSGAEVADVYKTTNWLKNWFESALLNGEVETDIVVLNPESNAAKDAELYKMYPRGLNIEKNKIIINNIEKALQVKAEYKNAKIRIYLTDIAIPFAIQNIEYSDAKNNYMKVDLYAPIISNDNRRPSFYVAKKNNGRLYDFYKDTLDRVICEANEIKKPIYLNDWLTDNSRTIAHRGCVDLYDIEHTRMSYEKCINQKRAMEVDILELSDGNLIVGRDCKLNENECSALKKEIDTKLSDLNIEQVKELNKICNNDRTWYKYLMEFSEFIKFIDGKVPLIIEIKSDLKNGLCDEDRQKAYDLVNKVYIILKDYKGQYAIHSSNPYVLKGYKKKDESIRCGQIVFDASKVDGMNKEVVAVYMEQKYLEIIKPDFISCRVDDIHKMFILTYCWRNKIPLLGWGIKNDIQRQIGKCCDNLIIN